MADRLGLLARRESVQKSWSLRKADMASVSFKLLRLRKLMEPELRSSLEELVGA